MIVGPENPATVKLNCAGELKKILQRLLLVLRAKIIANKNQFLGGNSRKEPFSEVSAIFDRNPNLGAG